MVSQFFPMPAGNITDKEKISNKYLRILFEAACNQNGYLIVERTIFGE
jgi:hypothetical protein